MLVEPLVSVVIPTYRRARILPEAIQSARHQTHTNLEIIVVDDGSGDGTEDVVKKIADSRLRYVRHVNNRGLPAARNTGIGAAQGEYVAFLDDDDAWRADKIEKQLRAITNADAVLCGALVNGVRIKMHPRDSVTLDDLRRDNAFDPSGLMARITVFRDIGFDERLRQGEDWDAFIRIAEKYRIAYVQEPLIVYNDGSHERMTRDARNLTGIELDKRMAVLHKHRKFFGDEWFHYHLASAFLSYIGTRNNRWHCIQFALNRCGLKPVLSVMARKATACLAGFVRWDSGKARMKVGLE